MLDDSAFFLQDTSAVTVPNPWPFLEPETISTVSSGKDKGQNIIMTLFFRAKRHGTTREMVSNINARRVELGIDRAGPAGGIQTLERVWEFKPD
ncbi:hypothetical protein LRS06_21995 [Hymenobacter sp. J193]|uniref:hypothetical protein n=1 Tax=Hymenobacter sp. J193 TaxID=2898429 RepID=UPI00215099E2|nr:hypothetical protein [Hymenobacter sp. J193]MCR5890403.1 hypothetical protein [Hymenobacter sp. J193]